MKNLFLTTIVILSFVLPMFSQIEVMTNGNVNIGNPSDTWNKFNVEGIITSERIYTSGPSVFAEAVAERYIDKDNYAYFLNPASTSNLHVLKATKLIDRNNNDFYVDPASTSVVNTIRATKFVDRNAVSYFLDPASTSNLHVLKATTFIDGNNDNFYLDPASTSNLNFVNAAKLTDLDDDNYYVDPASTSQLNILKVETLCPTTGSGITAVGTSADMFERVYTDVMRYASLDQLADENTKENIKEMGDQTSKLLSLQAKTFDYKAEVPKYGESEVSTGSRLKNRSGFIAQEVVDIFPEIVHLDPSTGLYTMNYTELIPVLVKVIQEQQEQIDILNELLPH